MTIARFVDAHVHLWQLGYLRYPWLTPPFGADGPNGNVAAIATDYTLDSYYADAAGFTVDKIVHIEAGAHRGDALRETVWLQGLAYDGGHPNAIVAYAPLNDPQVDVLLAAHTESPNVRGVRQILNWHEDPRLTYTERNLLEDDHFANGYALLAAYDLSFDMQIYPGQMIQAAALAAKHPNVQVILNHMGMPVDADLTEWRVGMAALAALPHVSVKISGFGFIDPAWTVDAMLPLVLETIDQFGPKRCAFASDFPTDKLFNSFTKALNAYDDMTNDFSGGERDALFATTAERIYRI